MDEDEKKDKLIKGTAGLVAIFALGYYVFSGNFKAQEWFPFLPPSPPPDTLIYHADAMRQALELKQYSIALSQAEWVLLRDKTSPEAIRTRTLCLLRVGRFKEAEQVFRGMIQKDKKDFAARLGLATALRGQRQDDKARAILLRILRDPDANTVHLDTARASLNGMDFKEPLFADQPTPPPLATPLPATSPSPQPLAPLTINPPGVSVPAALGVHATPTPFVFATANFNATPSPEPPVAAVTLKPPPAAPRATPEPGEAEPTAPLNTAPLEIPAPSDAAASTPPAATPGTRRILPATLLSEPKKAPLVSKSKKKASPAPKTKLKERR